MPKVQGDENALIELCSFVEGSCQECGFWAGGSGADVIEASRVHVELTCHRVVLEATYYGAVEP